MTPTGAFGEAGAILERALAGEIPRPEHAASAGLR